MYRLLMIQIDELWLKGGNRPQYLKMLREHILLVLKSYHTDKVQIKNEEQRFLVSSMTPFENETIEALANIPGINSISLALECEKEINQIFQTIEEEAEKILLPKTRFKVFVRRLDKNFSIPSMEMARDLGSLFYNRFPGLVVDLKTPEVVIDVKIMNKSAYVSIKKIPGVCGLPAGSSGRMLTLISGGFDSPVASYLMFRRGASQDFVFFYSYPYVSSLVKDKIFRLVKVLSKYQRKGRIFVVPFAKFQEVIADKSYNEYRTTLFRVGMVMIATRLAEIFKYQALITGDALGQVSSQTTQNLSVVQSFTHLPILRPLIGLNKQEIITLSKKILTHDISVEAQDDACSLFAPKHPVLRPELSYVQEFIEKEISPELLTTVINSVEYFNLDLKGKMSNSFSLV